MEDFLASVSSALMVTVQGTRYCSSKI